MTTDLGRRIRQLTETDPVPVDEVIRQADRHRRVSLVLAASVTLAVVAVVAGIVLVATRTTGASGQRVRVAGGPAPLRCFRLVEATTAAGAGAPVVRTSAVVFAPAASERAGGQQEVTVGLNTTEDGVALSIRREASGSQGVTYHVEQYEGDVAIGGSTSATFASMRAGDRVQVEIAVRNTDPRHAGSGPGGVIELSSIAYRLVDLRTHQSVQSGTARLLRGAPTPPIGVATSQHRDVSVTETTWGAGWHGLNVGLGDETIHQPATDSGGPLVGVTHTGAAVVIVDAAHPKGLVVGIAGLHARAGDTVVLEAATPPSGSRTAMTVTDQRSGACVSSPG
jgi:hypothetical protein